jgi:hypothetical protein
MAAASCLSVLRFASSSDNDESSLQLLTKHLVDHFDKINDNNSTSAGTTPQCVVQISNRYFSAHVALCPVVAESNDAVLPSKEDGIVLVWTTDDNDLEALTRVHDQAVATGGGDLLRLCVALDDDGSSSVAYNNKTPKEMEEDYSKRVLWCLDRGYEYIPSCDLSEEGVSRGHEDRDKEGFARLVEAIQGTVWSSAVMASKKNRKNTEVAQPEPREEASDQNAYEPPDPSKFSTTTIAVSSQTIESSEEVREVKARQALLLEEGREEDYLDGDEVDAAATLQERREEFANERVFNEFEGAIKEAARIRDVSQSGQLSDEERRKRAGDAAVILMDLMGKMGYDDDEEGVEDSSDDEKEEKVES